MSEEYVPQNSTSQSPGPGTRNPTFLSSHRQILSLICTSDPFDRGRQLKTSWV